VIALQILEPCCEILVFGVGLLKLGLEMTYAVVLLGEFVLKGCDTLVKALEFVDECLECLCIRAGTVCVCVH